MKTDLKLHFQVDGKSQKYHERSIVLSIAGLCRLYCYEFTTIWWGNWNPSFFFQLKSFESKLILFSKFIFFGNFQYFLQPHHKTIHNFTFNILLNLNSFFTQILFNYISCYYANDVTIKALSAAEVVYDIHWYKLPANKQLFIQLMIERAQKPFYLKGYDIVDCSLATFLNVRTSD